MIEGNLYSLYTFRSPDLMCVWNDGASADTSHMYLLVALISNLCKTIWLAFDDSIWKFLMFLYKVFKTVIRQTVVIPIR